MNNRSRLRVKLTVTAKGVIRAQNTFLQFTGTVVNLSMAGAAIRFSEATSAEAKKITGSGVDLQDAEIMVKLISYVENNVPASGVVSYLTESSGHIIAGVKFNSLGKKSVAILEKLLSMAPDLMASKRRASTEVLTKFTDFNEFLDELTQFVVLSEKQAQFYIGKEKFAFAGMHRDDNGEIHRDCIESVDRPGVLYCPDCRNKIEQKTLI